MKITIAIKQYTTQRAAQKHCAKIQAKVIKRFNADVAIVVNRLEAEVFQVELTGEFPDPEDRTIDLIDLT